MDKYRAAFMSVALILAGIVGHYVANPIVVNPTPIVVPIPDPNTTTIPPIPRPDVTIVPVVPVNPVNPCPPVVVPVIPKPVNPIPVPVVPIPAADPIALEIGELDSEFSDSESKKSTALAKLNKYKTLLQGVETKHGLLPVPMPTPLPVPTPTPTPTPVNPTPVNPTPVAPVIVAPVGFRVIVVFDPMGNNTRDQLTVLNSTAIRDYLNQKCAKGSDGRPEWRVWSPSVEFGVTTKESQTMVDLWNTVKAQMGPLMVGTSPQLVIAVNGSVKVYPLPIPETVALAFLKSLGG